MNDSKADRKRDDGKTVTLGAAMAVLKTKSPSSKDRHQTYAIEGPSPFTMFCAGDGQAGGGIVLFDDLGIRAIPAPDTAWREAPKGQRKVADKPRSSDGRWQPWFLLTRALVMSGDALVAGELELAPADSIEEAHQQLRESARVRHQAGEARTHAITEYLYIDESLDIGVGRSERAFIDWFGSVMADRLASGDLVFVEAVTEFARIAKRIPRDVPAEVRDLCQAITCAAVAVGGLPTKGEVLAAMKKINRVYADEVRIRDLRKRAGFQWLPEGKSGPK